MKISNCCGAEVLQPDSNGHGKCSECFENCTSEEIENGNNKDKLFITFDINIAAALVSLGFPINTITKKNPKKVCFIFLNTFQLKEVINLYWNDDLRVNARSLLDTLRMLKYRLSSNESSLDKVDLIEKNGSINTLK